MKNLNNINNFRRIALYGNSYLGDEHNGAFVVDKFNKNGEFYLVIVSNGQGWDHVSVSLHKKNGNNINRCPSFEEMQMIKAKIFGEDEVVFQLHPREEDYINTHPYCLHLWKPNSCDMVLPPMHSLDNVEILKNECFEYNNIIVRVRIGEVDGWQIAKVDCFTKDGKQIKSGPSWDVMCEAKKFVFGNKEAAFQFMMDTANSDHSCLNLWFPINLDLMPPLPDSILVGTNKKK